MKIQHHKQVVDMLGKEWDLCKVKSKAIGNTCAWIYWFEILSEAERFVLEYSDGKVIGICAYSKWNSKKFWLRKKYYLLLKWILMHSFLIRDKLEMKKYDSDYDFLPLDIENLYDGEIAIIILDKNNRGKGIGKKMFQKTLEIAKEDDMKNIVILSDETSNYKFYENLGCKKIYEMKVDNGEPNENGEIEPEMGYAYGIHF